jgi:hypothetical protein
MSLWESLEGESVKVIPGGGSKFPGGVYLVGLEVHRDRIAVSIFTSRETSVAELAERLTMEDGVGTAYAMQPVATETIDGKGVIEFVPSLPRAATWLSLGVPGNRFWVTTLRKRTESDG